MKPHQEARPFPKTVPADGKFRGGFYRYGGSKTFPQPGEKPKK